MQAGPAGFRVLASAPRKERNEGRNQCWVVMRNGT